MTQTMTENRPGTAIPGGPLETPPLWMVRFEIDIPEFEKWRGMRGLHDPDHGLHCLMTESMGSLAPKPFRMMISAGGKRASLFGYSSTDVDSLRQAIRTFADPRQIRAIPPGEVDSKLMPADWEPGQRLGFETRVRPIVRMKDRRDESRPNACGEMDIHSRTMYSYQHESPEGDNPPQREETYLDWLAARLESAGAAELDRDRTVMKRFQMVSSVRSSGGRPVKGPDATFHGTLTIRDPDEFRKLLKPGIGRHRAYGYGMLLLRPPMD